MVAFMGPRARNTFLLCETRWDREAGSCGLPSGHSLGVCKSENMERLIWPLCPPGGREIIDDWLKSQYPSGDIIGTARLHFSELISLNGSCL